MSDTNTGGRPIKLTGEQKRCLNGSLCPYCKNPPKLFKDSTPIYGKDYGPVWACLPCQAWVGCHPGGIKPLGRLAKKPLRMLKHQVHEVFDKTWQYKLFRSRRQAYKWLSKQLDIPEKYTHVGMFNEETCKKAIIICKKRLEEHWKHKNLAR